MILALLLAAIMSDGSIILFLDLLDEQIHCYHLWLSAFHLQGCFFIYLFVLFVLFKSDAYYLQIMIRTLFSCFVCVVHILAAL